MHPLFEKASGLTGTIIAAAIEVHREMGPGLLESVYETCLALELTKRGLAIEEEKPCPWSTKPSARSADRLQCPGGKLRR